MMERKFDKEYATQWEKEVIFLESKDIKPTFVKTNIYNIRTYKYARNYELFSALTELYSE